MTKLLTIHGPNLNLLGTREPEIYGTMTLADIDAGLVTQAQAAGHEMECFQSNAEHDIVDRVHSARDQGVAYIFFNPGAFTHTSLAIRDALLGVAIPFIEVHLSNVHSREAFRQHSYLSDVAVGCVIGLGARGYGLALQAAIEKLEDQ